MTFNPHNSVENQNAGKLSYGPPCLTGLGTVQSFVLGAGGDNDDADPLSPTGAS